jgi:hypothetical protein
MILGVAQASEDKMNPGDREALLSQLEKARRNIVEQVLRFTQVQKAPPSFNYFHIEKVGEVSMNKTQIGNIQDSIVSIGSSITDSIQTLTKSNTVPPHKKDEFEQLLKDLHENLKTLANKQPTEAEAVGKIAESVTREMTKEKPNQSYLRITLEGLTAAATAVQAIAPAVLETTKKIVEFIVGLKLI